MRFDESKQYVVDPAARARILRISENLRIRPLRYAQRRRRAKGVAEYAPGEEICLPGTGRALFRVDQLIGTGGFGEVYAATAVGGAARRFALKRVRYSRFDEKNRAEVERQHCDEALLMLQLGAHANVVALHCEIPDPLSGRPT